MPLFGNGGLMGKVNLADELGQSTEAANSNVESYRKPLNVNRFDSFGAGSMTQGEPVELARVETPAGLERRWGFGKADTPDNQGYAYGVFANANDEQIHGILSLEWENATGRQTQVSEELASEDMDTADRYNRESQPPVPEQQGKQKASQDEFLVVKFTPQTDPADITNSYAIDAAASECRLPTTEYDVSA